MIKGIIFDLDGTTLNTLYDIQASLNILLKNHNYPEMDYDGVRLNIGRGTRNLVQDSCPEGLDEKTIDELTQEYFGIYDKNFNTLTKPYEGIKDVINELDEKGILLAVNSNKPDELSNILMKYHFPGNSFVAIIGAKQGIPYKPDPYSANEIINLMKLEKHEILYVGDSESDILTARNAGVKSVGCLWGFRDYDTLSKTGADYIISKPYELLEILEKNI